MDAGARAVLRGAGIDWPKMPPGIEPDSEVGYAARVLGLTRVLLPMLEHRDTELAADIAFDLGRLTQEATMKWRHEAAALEGGKIRAGRAEANEERRKARQADWGAWQAQAILTWERNPDWPKARVMRAVRKKLGLRVNDSTLRRHIHKPGK